MSNLKTEPYTDEFVEKTIKEISDSFPEAGGMTLYQFIHPDNNEESINKNSQLAMAFIIRSDRKRVMQELSKVLQEVMEALATVLSRDGGSSEKSLME